MLEQELSQLQQRLAERTIGDRPAIRMNEVLGAVLPRGIKAYLQAETMRLLDHDLRTAPAMCHVDRESPGTAPLLRSFGRSLSYAFVFNRQEYIAALDDAVHFVANYLFRPQWMLEQFLLDEAESVRVADLDTKLSFVADYSYFGDLLRRILQRRQAVEVTAADLRALLARIDDQIVRQHTPRELSNLTKPIFAFMLLDEDPADRRISIGPLLLFFEDKKMQFLRDYIEGICKVRSVSELSLPELSILIEDLYSAEAPAQAGGGAAAAESMSAPKSDPAAQSPPTVETADGAAPEAAAPEEAPGPAVPEAPEEPAAHAEPDEKTGPFAPPPPAELAVILPDFETAMSDQQRRRIVKKIFQRDEDYFRTVARALNDLDTWEEAKVYLKEFFRTNDIDPFAEDVVEFTDLVQQRFRQHKGEPR